MVGDTGDNNSGHITTSLRDGILFFNSILPPNLQWLSHATSSLGSKTKSILDPTTSRFGAVNPAQVFATATKKANVGHADVVEVLPRYSEGGAFLKFSTDGTIDAETVARAVSEHLNTHLARAWWKPLASVRASLVRGKPWVEDLSRHPSRRLRVEFLPTEPGAEAAELNQEQQLYSFFRPFGKLSDTVAQPSDSKVLPRFAYLDFANY